MDRLFEPPLPAPGMAEGGKYGFAIGDRVEISGNDPFKGRHGVVGAFGETAVGVSFKDNNPPTSGLWFDPRNLQKV